MHMNQKSKLALAAAIVAVMVLMVAVFGYRERNAGRDLPVECEPSRLPTVERWRENAARALSAFEAS